LNFAADWNGIAGSSRKAWSIKSASGQGSFASRYRIGSNESSLRSSL